MTEFVSLRVVVRPGESNAAALHRTLIECGILVYLPRTVPNMHDEPKSQWRITSEAAIPLVSTKRYSDTFTVKYE